MSFSLLPFDKNHVLQPRGLPNETRIHCYWNSTLQALISCPQFVSTIHNMLPGNEGTIIEALILFMSGKISNMDLYKCYVIALSTIGKSTPYLHELVANQQCVGETMTYFLEIFEKSVDIMRLFEHRYVYDLVCMDCQNKSKTITTSIMFEVSPNTNLVKEICESIDIIEGYKCDKCKQASNKPKYGKVTMLPEILAVVVKNYAWADGAGKKQLIASDFPEFIDIEPIHYRAVAYIDHFGRLDYGHYISTCLRLDADGNLGWFTFNDDIVSPASFSPGPNTYMALYSCYNAEQ
jgi:ubiquitin C-terminal hydrolase